MTRYRILYPSFLMMPQLLKEQKYLVEGDKTYKNLLILFMITAGILLGGCGWHRYVIFKPGPKGIANIKEERDKANVAFNKYYDLYYPKESNPNGSNPPDPTKKKEYRNEAVHARLRAIDIEYNLFKLDLYMQGVLRRTAVDWVILGIGGATATIGGAGTKAALGATSGGLSGANAAFEKNAFYEFTMPVIVQKMDSLKEKRKEEIIEKLKKPPDEYPLLAAMDDLAVYEALGTLPTVLAEISKEMGPTLIEQNKELKKVLDNLTKGTVNMGLLALFYDEIEEELKAGGNTPKYNALEKWMKDKGYDTTDLKTKKPSFITDPAASQIREEAVQYFKVRGHI